MIGLSERARDATLALVAGLIDGAGVPGRLEIFAVDGTLLTALEFSWPSASAINDGLLIFGPLGEGKVRESGKAVSARGVDATGDLVFTASVGPFDSDATIRLRNVVLVAGGGPVIIESFTIEAPAGAAA